MKFNISMEDAKFIVNEEKHVVVCVIEDTKALLVNFVNDNFHIGTDLGLTYWSKYNDKAFRDKLYMPNKFVGIATCGPDDEWNEDIGRLIAFSRAKDNLLKSFFKHAQIYISSLEDWLDEAVTVFNNLGDKLAENSEHRHAYIEELLGPEPESNNGNTADN